MTQQEIQDRNKDIALMLGALSKNMDWGWMLEDDELNLSFDIFNEKIFSNDGGSGWKIQNLKFHSDWNWLMEAVKKILSIESEDDCLETYYTIIDQIPDIEAVFLAVSDFAKKFNNKES